VTKICLLDEIPGNTATFFAKLGLQDVVGVVVNEEADKNQATTDDDSSSRKFEKKPKSLNNNPIQGKKKEKSKNHNIVVKSDSHSITKTQTAVDESQKRKAEEVSEDVFVRKIKRKLD
jgi:hypothetical protein